MFAFNPENKVLQFLAKCASILFATFLWMLFCAPVITAGASTCAMIATMWQIGEEDNVSVFNEFWRRLKENFAAATKAWAIALPVGILLGGNIYACGMMTQKTLIFEIMKGSTFVFSFCYLITVFYLFAYLAKYNDTILHSIKNSFLFGGRYIKETLWMLLLFAVSAFFLYFTEWYAVIFAAPSLYLYAKALNSVFAKNESMKQKAEALDD